MNKEVTAWRACSAKGQRVKTPETERWQQAHHWQYEEDHQRWLHQWDCSIHHWTIVYEALFQSVIKAEKVLQLWLSSYHLGWIVQNCKDPSRAWWIQNSSRSSEKDKKEDSCLRRSWTHWRSWNHLQVYWWRMQYQDNSQEDWHRSLLGSVSKAWMSTRRHSQVPPSSILGFH